MSEFSSTIVEYFPELRKASANLYEVATWLSMVIVFGGLVLKIWQGNLGQPMEVVRGLTTAGLIGAVVIPFFPDWTNELQLMGHSVVEKLDADPSDSYRKFARLVTSSSEGEDLDVGFFDVLWSDEGGIGKALLYVFILIASKVAMAIMWLAFIIQQALILFQIALAPIFLALFMYEGSRGVAVKYLLSLGSVLLWPLGWAIADLLTTGLLNLALQERVYEVLGGATTVSGPQTLFFILVISAWLVLSTVLAPFAITKMMTQGASAGSSFLGGVGGALSQGLSYGAGAGATASMGGASRGGIILAGMTAGLGGAVSGAMGRTGMVLPAAIGLGAAMSSSKSEPRDMDYYLSVAENKMKGGRK